MKSWLETWNIRKKNNIKVRVNELDWIFILIGKGNLISEKKKGKINTFLKFNITLVVQLFCFIKHKSLFFSLYIKIKTIATLFYSPKGYFCNQVGRL